MSNADGFDNNPGGAPPPPPPPISHEPAPPPADTGAGGIGGTGLDRNVAAGLACLFSWVGGLVFLLIEKKDRYVRFYAMQSLLLGGAWMAFFFGMQILLAMVGIIPLFGKIIVVLAWPIIGLLGLAVFAVSLVAAIKAFGGGPEWEIPVLGPIARAQLDKV